MLVLHSIGKSFNYSSTQMGYTLTTNSELSRRLEEVLQNHHEKVELFALATTEGCLSQEGLAWIDYVSKLVTSNYRRLRTAIQQKLSGVKMGRLLGGYLVYLDFSSYFDTAAQMMAVLEAENIFALGLASNY